MVMSSLFPEQWLLLFILSPHSDIIARYKDGLNLFRFLHEQRLKESLANYGVDAPHKRVVYELYGDSKIFALLLECCAQGRFGMEAIQLYSEREDFLAKNLVDRSDSYYSQRYILQGSIPSLYASILSFSFF